MSLKYHVPQDGPNRYLLAKTGDRKCNVQGRGYTSYRKSKIVEHPVCQTRYLATGSGTKNAQGFVACLEIDYHTGAENYYE